MADGARPGLTPAQRRPIAIAVLVVLALLPVLVLGLVAQRAGAEAAKGEPPPEATPGPVAPELVVATPILSARRTPGTVSGRTQADALVVALRDLTGSLPAASCFSSTVAGVPSVAQGTEALLPASTLKIATASAALDVLGADHTFHTSVQATATPADGVVEGDLWLVGGGDPVLATEGYNAARTARGLQPQQPRTSLESLADSVVAAGVTRVTGSVRGDDSRYDTARSVATWPPSYVSDLEVGPLGALMVDDGAASLSPLQASGNPAAAAATTFTSMLRARGVQVGGQPTTGAAPAGAVEVTGIDSAPLSEIVAGLLQHSDNTTAELLVKELGHTAGAGTTAAGTQVVLDRLRARSVPVDGAVLVDGSGLDRGNRVPCALLADLLATEPVDGPLVQGLAIAGETGTLADDFLGNPVQGKLRAKTGSLRDVRALAGVWAPPGAAPVTFSLIDNDPDAEGRAAALWDQLGRALAQYPAPVDLTAFRPAPPRAP
jgi:serine-type D-Ala-D-Ala carboxypeptidase/endopeptidase (penicillin-binding protein 4)